MFAVPNDSDVCSEIPWLSTSQGERPSSGLEEEDDPEGEQQQADRERHRPHDDGATNEGWRVHPVSVRASGTHGARSAAAGFGFPPLDARNGPDGGHPDVEKPGNKGEECEKDAFRAGHPVTPF